MCLLFTVKSKGLPILKMFVNVETMEGLKQILFVK